MSVEVFQFLNINFTIIILNNKMNTIDAAAVIPNLDMSFDNFSSFICKGV
jgi:hypothetical protein